MLLGHEHPGRRRLWVYLLAGAVVFAGMVAAVAVRYGIREPGERIVLLRVIEVVLALCVVPLHVWFSRHVRRLPIYGRAVWVDRWLLAGLAVGLCGLYSPTSHWWVAYDITASVGLVVYLWRLQALVARLLHRPGLLLPVSFALMIAACTLLLKLPRATPVGQSIGWIDALFTATSAVCVTGLIVRDTATQFTPFGQTIIGVFIQLGGLGIMSFGAVLAALLGSRMSLRENVSLSQMLIDQPLARLVSFTRFVVLATLAIELLGALLMMPMWHAPMPLGERFGRSLFHSVSAFCNAGFALQTDSLEGYRFNVLTHLVFIPLIVIGGIGFPVLDNLRSVLMHRLSRRRRVLGGWDRDHVNLEGARLTLHTKVVLTNTAGLYLLRVGAIATSQMMPYVHDRLN